MHKQGIILGSHQPGDGSSYLLGKLHPEHLWASTFSFSLRTLEFSIGSTEVRMFQGGQEFLYGTAHHHVDIFVGKHAGNAFLMNTLRMFMIIYNPSDGSYRIIHRSEGLRDENVYPDDPLRASLVGLKQEYMPLPSDAAVRAAINGPYEPLHAASHQSHGNRPKAPARG